MRDECRGSSTWVESSPPQRLLAFKDQGTGQRLVRRKSDLDQGLAKDLGPNVKLRRPLRPPPVQQAPGFLTLVPVREIVPPDDQGDLGPYGRRPQLFDRFVPIRARALAQGTVYSRFFGCLLVAAHFAQSGGVWVNKAGWPGDSAARRRGLRRTLKGAGRNRLSSSWLRRFGLDLRAFGGFVSPCSHMEKMKKYPIGSGSMP